MNTKVNSESVAKTQIFHPILMNPLHSWTQMLNFLMILRLLVAVLPPAAAAAVAAALLISITILYYLVT